MADYSIRSIPRRAVARALGAAAFLAAALVLAACNDSPTAIANKDNATKANEAARIMGSAGDFRPKDNFPDKLSAPLEDLNDLNKLEAKAQEAGRTKPETYLQTPNVLKDLNDALALLHDASTSSDAPFRSEVDAEMGLGSAQEAAIKLGEAQSEYREAGNKADDIVSMAQQLTELNNRINLLDARKDGLSKGLADSLKTAQADAGTAQKTLDDKQSALAALQQGVDDKRRKSSELFDQAQAAQMAADQAKEGSRLRYKHAGSRAEILKMVDDSLQADAAVEASLTQAEKLSEDASNDQAQLNQTEHDVEIAKLDFQEKDNLVKTYQQTMDFNQKQVNSIDGLLKDINDEKSQLADEMGKQLKNVDKTLDNVLGSVDVSAADADKAKAAFQKALKSQKLVPDEAAKLVSDKGYDEKDPLIQVLRDPSPEYLLDLNLAAANYREAQAQLIGVHADDVRTLISHHAQAAGAADVAANSEPATSTSPGKDHRREAAMDLREARKVLSDAARAITTAKFPDLAGQNGVNGKQALKWLVPYLDAAVQHAIIGITDDDQERASATTQLQKDVDDARRANPFLTLDVYAAAIGAPAPAPADNTVPADTQAPTAPADNPAPADTQPATAPADSAPAAQ